MRVWIVSVTVLLLWGGTAVAETWNVGLRADHAPYSHRAADGLPAGVDVELISTVLARIEVEPVFHFLAEDERLKAFHSGALDMLAQVQGVPARFEDWDMVGPMRARRVIVVGGPYDAPDWTRLSDFQDKIIAEVAGQDYGPLYARAGELETETYPNLKAALDKLGWTVHYVIGAEIAVLQAARNSRSAGELRVLEKPFDVMPLYVAFPKSPASLSFDRSDVPKAERFRSALDAARSDGTISAILARWRNRQGVSIQ